ncbi:MAG TPA: flagellar biosynthesis protein FlhB [Rhizomicrobium sp.]|jgi:flagellar biosynthetic protein FlhB|nr:flagellar biosynthesis protein FlhB [Rhizomicrobium sp.]
MADENDDSQKTEQPTQRRLDDAREHGDLVKSQEVNTLILLAGGTLVIALFGQPAAKAFAQNFLVFLQQPEQLAVGGADMQGLMQHALIGLAAILGPVLGLMMGAGVVGNLIQNRPTFSTEKLKPDFSKLSLLKGLKRMFGMEGIANLVKGLLKMGAVGIALWTVLWPERGRLEAVMGEAPSDIASDMIHLLIRILIAALIVLAAIAAADYGYVYFQFMRRNRMSKQEIKDEYKQTEGDPTVKAKIKQVRQERSRRRMMAAVPEATVIIANPTHFAVALKYESGVMAAPVCVAKGVDALALKIREVAEAHEVPVIENPPLARALYASVEIDEAVPPEHYKAVAQVIGYVMRLTGKLRPN